MDLWSHHAAYLECKREVSITAPYPTTLMQTMIITKFRKGNLGPLLTKTPLTEVPKKCTAFLEKMNFGKFICSNLDTEIDLFQVYLYIFFPVT